jgi:hypothetical protein
MFIIFCSSASKSLFSVASVVVADSTGCMGTSPISFAASEDDVTTSILLILLLLLLLTLKLLLLLLHRNSDNQIFEKNLERLREKPEDDLG